MCAIHLWRHTNVVVRTRDKRMNDCRYARAFGASQYVYAVIRKICLTQYARAHRVLNVVVHVGNAVCHTDNVALFGICHPIGMAENAVADFCRQIQSLPVLLDQVYYTKALLIVSVPMGADAVENRFSAVPERRMSQIVSQCNGFGQILVEPQSTGNGTGNLCDFQRMGKTSAVVISGRGKEKV